MLEIPKKDLWRMVLRAFRGIRFIITKGLNPEEELVEALQSEWIIEIISYISIERIKQEMTKCFKYNTLKTIKVLEEYPLIRKYLFSILWLEPSNKKI